MSKKEKADFTISSEYLVPLLGAMLITGIFIGVYYIPKEPVVPVVLTDDNLMIKSGSSSIDYFAVGSDGNLFFKWHHLTTLTQTNFNCQSKESITPSPTVLEIENKGSD